MGNLKGIITHVQRMSFHDGVGIRDTIFLKDVIFDVSGVIIQKLYLYDLKLVGIRNGVFIVVSVLINAGRKHCLL